jgi:hypothetical protein
VFERQVNASEAFVRNELRKVRDWAAARIKGGKVSDWSWRHHVELIESVDAVLHDISIETSTSRSLRRSFGNFRLVECGSELNHNVHITLDSEMKRKSRSAH